MGRDLTANTLTLTDLTAEEHAAVLYVCAIAADIDEARELLDALGLNGRPVHSSGRQQSRRRFSCQRGHPRTPDNVNKSNQCRECARENNRNWYARSKAARA